MYILFVFTHNVMCTQTAIGNVSITVRRLKSSTDGDVRRESNRNDRSSNGLMAAGQYGMTKSTSNLSGFSSSSTGKGFATLFIFLFLSFGHPVQRFLQASRQRCSFIRRLVCGLKI
jgi:hypothetical protein